MNELLGVGLLLIAMIVIHWLVYLTWQLEVTKDELKMLKKVLKLGGNK